MRAQSPPAPAEDPQKAQEGGSGKLEEEVQALKAAQANAKSEPAQLGGGGRFGGPTAMNPDSSLTLLGGRRAQRRPARTQHWKCTRRSWGSSRHRPLLLGGMRSFRSASTGVQCGGKRTFAHALPGEFVAKIGKMRAGFPGKVEHHANNHALGG